MLKIKPGVIVHGLSNELLLAVMVAHSVFEDRGYSCIITSLLDGKHSRTSLHYSGNGLDLRTRHLPSREYAESIVDELRDSLTADYDVILEEDHIHVEYQPKR